MKIYWADREGNPAPPDSVFSYQPFTGNLQTFPQCTRVETLPPGAPALKVRKKTFAPDYASWCQGVQKALKQIDQKELLKVVLARTCTLELEAAPDPFTIVSALKERAQGAFLFCLETKDFAFLGASPERLYLRNQNQIISEAVAGTRKRGGNSLEDEDLRETLLKNPKDLREFSPVQAYLQEILTPLCIAPLIFTPLSIHQTQNVQHLYSRCTGELKERISDTAILQQLHPTPALCGIPKEKAHSLIEEVEPFQRGLYGGAIGWSTPEASEWVVGIRSCLIQGNRVILYSGTGIVEGSDPKEEWDELDQKLKLYQDIFN